MPKPIWSSSKDSLANQNYSSGKWTLYRIDFSFYRIDLRCVSKRLYMCIETTSICIETNLYRNDRNGTKSFRYKSFVHWRSRMLALLPFFAFNYLFSALCWGKTALLSANQNRVIFSCILLCISQIKASTSTPPGIPRAFDVFSCPGGGNLFNLIFPGAGIWSLLIGGGEFDR